MSAENDTKLENPVVQNDDVSVSLLSVNDHENKTPGRCSQFCSWFISERHLVSKTVVGCILGFGLGALLNAYHLSDDVLDIIGFPGELFIRALKLLAVPLIAVLMISIPSELGGDLQKAKQMSIRTIGLFLLNMVTSIPCGIIAVYIFNPGLRSDIVPPDPEEETDLQEITAVQSILNIGRDAIDENVTASFLNFNILGILIFFIWFGISVMITNAGSKPKIFDIAIEATNSLLGMINLVIYLTPICVLSLIAAVIARLDDIWSVMESLAFYVVALFVAEFIYVFVVIPIVYFAFMRKNPLQFFKDCTQPALVAFATASSVAAIPVNLRCCRDTCGVRESITGFVVPLGAAVNKPGSAIFLPVAVIFIAQLIGQDLSAVDVLLVGILSAFISAGAASIPYSSLVFSIIILNAVGIDGDEYISLILAVDWLVDRIRTAINIMADTLVAVIVENMSAKTDIHTV